jgi:hypothetical protein
MQLLLFAPFGTEIPSTFDCSWKAQLTAETTSFVQQCLHVSSRQAQVRAAGIRLVLGAMMCQMTRGISYIRDCPTVHHHQ